MMTILPGQPSASQINCHLSLHQPPFAVIFSDGEVFAPTGDDADYGYNLTVDRDPSAGQSQQNPRSEAQGDIVIEIPENSELAAVEFFDPYIDSSFCTTIELTDVG